MLNIVTCQVTCTAAVHVSLETMPLLTSYSQRLDLDASPGPL